MVLVRSAFWLTLAYFAIGPRIDYAQTVDDLSSQALASGQQLVLEKVNNTQCSSLECAGAKMILSASLGNEAGQQNSTGPVVHAALGTVAPLPRPRLERTG